MAPPTTQESTESGDGEASAQNKPLVLLADVLIPEFHQALAPRYRLHPAAGADAATASTARALITVELPAVTSDLIDTLPALELVVTSSVGVDHVDLAACRRGAWAAAAHGGEFPLATKVSGKRVGIVGLGSIGTAVARRLAAFGCHVAYTSRSPRPAAACPYAFYPTVASLAADSDVLVLACALTEDTRRVVGRQVMEALGPRGVLVNVGRGGLVDEPELVRCLRDGVIGGAGLDVYEDEPRVPPELFGMDNVVLSKHSAVAAEESIRGVLDVVAGNLDAFFSGRPLLSPVQL